MVAVLTLARSVADVCVTFLKYLYGMAACPVFWFE